MRRPGPTTFSAPLDEAIALHRRGKLNPAKKLYREVIARQPNNSDALELFGTLLGEMGETAEAAKVLTRAQAVNPGSLNIQFNLGMALKGERRFAEAEACFRAAVALAPQRPEAHLLLGQVLFEQGKLAEAVACYQAALLGNSRSADAWLNLGQAQRRLGSLEAAIESFGRAAALEPRSTEPLCEQARALLQMGRNGAAVDVLARAIDIDPKSYDALAVRGVALRLERRYGEAIAMLERATALARNQVDALFELVMTKRTIADWSDHDRLDKAMARAAGRPEGAHLQAVFLLDSPALHQRAARSLVDVRWPGTAAGAPQRAPPAAATPLVRRPGPVRLAYVTSDFGDHPTGYALTGLLRAHDRKHFEVHGFALSADDGSAVRRANRAACMRFHEVADQDAGQIVAAARTAGIDIAIDFNGHLAGARSAVFAQRMAPIQVNYQGYPGTIGATWMDYLVADGRVIAPGADGVFDETLVRLPGCYLANNLAGERIEARPSRVEAGLPAEGFVFASFNSTYKITPALFDCWMRLLAGVPGAVLWLTGAFAAADNLRREAAARGVAGDRIIHAPFVKDRAAHLARQSLVDIFLDCQPYNGHTTTADALWAGVPVITCPGQSFPARVAASVLTAAGCPELIAADMAAYEALALRLARSPAELTELKAKLAAARKTSPLFDPAHLARHLELAFTRMVEMAVAGQPPAAFDVPAESAT